MSYAVIFDLDTEILKKIYPVDSYGNASNEIKKFLTIKGFEWQQGSVYFGEKINAVQCIMAIQELSKIHTWFKVAVKDIRMLKIEEMNDLSPVL